MNRRTAAGLLVVGGSTVVGGIVGVPAFIAAVSPAWKPRPEAWRPLGKLSEFPAGRVGRGVVAADRDTWPRTFGEEMVFVWRRSESEVVVFSRSCTDLGCP